MNDISLEHVGARGRFHAATPAAEPLHVRQESEAPGLAAAVAASHYIVLTLELHCYAFLEAFAASRYSRMSLSIVWTASTCAGPGVTASSTSVVAASKAMRCTSRRRL